MRVSSADTESTNAVPDPRNLKGDSAQSADCDLPEQQPAAAAGAASDSSLPMAGESVAFTGTLASMVHREAARLVEQYGGRATHAVSGSSSMLVVGEEGWPLESDGTPSQKMQQAMNLITGGHSLRIVPESDWLHLLGLNARRDEIQRAYTPAMLSRLLDVPVRLIRRWARLGLIRAVRRVCRLPYFDYREVASARRLAALLDEGVSAEKIERSLSELGQALSGTDRSLAQLNLLVRDESVLLRDAKGVVNPRTGQRLLDFELYESPTAASTAITSGEAPPASAPSSTSLGQHLKIRPDATLPAKGRFTVGRDPDDPDDVDEDYPVSLSLTEARLRLGDRRMSDWNADEWFHEGCRLAEESEFESAINAFRNAMSLLVSEHSLLREATLFSLSERSGVFPDPADVNFHLADALYRAGYKEAAIERYHSAIEFAPDFIEAWTQLGCLQSELKLWEQAEDSLRTAMSVHPENPDVLLHFAQLMDQMNRPEEAVEFWESYLEHDSRGPWADHARSRLEQFRSSQQPAT